MVLSPIFFSHANGFPASTYRTLLSKIGDDREVLSIDTIGHNPQFPVNNNWTHLVEELISEIEKKCSVPVVGLGHSLGGALTLFAAIKRPELFEQIILLDSPILCAYKTRMIQLLKQHRRMKWVTPGGNSIVGRQQHWETIEEAKAYVSSRRLFESFTASCLEDFVQHGLKPSENGQGLQLKFSPQIEYQIYNTLPDNYRFYKKQLKVPGLSLVGETTTIINWLDKQAMKSYFNLSVETVPGGHLFPFEYPDEAAARIKRAIKNEETLAWKNCG